MIKNLLFTPINYERESSCSEKALSTLSKYFSLGKTVAIVAKNDQVYTKIKKKHWYEVALKVASYVILFPLILPSLALYMGLYLKRNFIIDTSTSADFLNKSIQIKTQSIFSEPEQNDSISESVKTVKNPEIVKSAHNIVETTHTTETSPIRESFITFINELEAEIFEFYERHENTFDKFSIHGRMHVARAVIFCEVMIRYFQSKGQSVDCDYVRRVTALHDAGRQGNGVDRWENESADLLYKHLKSKGMADNEALEKSRIIIKNKKQENLLEYIIFQSADCLDIMRECTGQGGRQGFKDQFLTFLKGAPIETEDYKFRQEFIEEAWEFIKITEEKKLTDFKSNEGFMKRLLEILKDNSKKFKILSSIL